ncbi:MAG: CinA family nicotinamide mononucleotide deamidase-related protein [Myxococcales bacterium]|nr:CinA family nicotinamide mononucleotide deamidase-related protein [Myxococcales bacterium]
MRIELLTTGDEVLDGTIVDTNAGHIERQLDALGYRVERVTAVRDDRAELEAALRAITARASVCITSGGLGPTDDDLTVDALAAVAGVDFEHDEVAWGHILARYGDRPVPPRNRRQARRPVGGRLLYSEVGTAPGVALTVGGCQVFCVPGVPREMAWHLERHVLPALGTPTPGVVRRSVRLVLIGESTAEEKLATISLPPEVAVGWRALDTEVELKLRGPEAAVAVAEAAVRRLFGPVAIEEADVATAALAACQRAGLSLGTAESCTGGLVGAALTDVPGASAVFFGSVVSYANSVKMDVLGVPEAVLRAHGAVSEPCAAAMALGAQRALGVDVAVSITGVAGPGGGSPERPVGTVCFGFAGPAPGQVRTETRHFRGDRSLVRRYAVAFALDGVRREVMGGKA